MVFCLPVCFAPPSPIQEGRERDPAMVRFSPMWVRQKKKQLTYLNVISGGIFTVSDKYK